MKTIAEALETFVSKVNPKDITRRQIYEIARGLDAMLSQGAATISGTKKLIPETAAGDVATIAEYILNIPKGARQQAFIQQMMDTVKREKDLAKTQVQGTQKKILSGYSHLKKADPERYNETLTAFGLPTDESTQEQQSQKREDVQAYANDHFNGDYDKAFKYLKDSGQL